MEIKNRKKLKVLIVTQYFWPENFRVNDLSLGLTERGHQVTVFTGMPNYPKGSFFPGYGYFGPYKEWYQTIVEVLRIPLLPRGPGKGLQLIANYFWFLLFGSLFIPIMCRKKYDVIFVYEISPITVAIPAILLKWLRNIPMVLWVTDLWPESLAATGSVKSRFILNQVSKLVRFIYRHCDEILISGQGFIKNILQHGGSAAKVNYLPQWAESFFSNKNDFIIDPNPISFPEGFRILFAGNIGVAQSFETILGAAELLINDKNIQWIILGDGAERPWVEAEITRRYLGSCVHLLGSRPFENMPWYYSQADALLVSLKPNPLFEITIPSKVQTYLASGKPILGSIDGEGATVIKNANCGFVSVAGDKLALAAAASKMSNLSQEDREVMGKNGVAYFTANFEREKALDKIENIFNKTILNNAKKLKI